MRKTNSSLSDSSNEWPMLRLRSQANDKGIICAIVLFDVSLISGIISSQQINLQKVVANDRYEGLAKILVKSHLRVPGDAIVLGLVNR